MRTLCRTEAAWLITRHCMERIVSDGESPRDALQLLNDTSFAAADVLPDNRVFGDGLRLGSLLGYYYSYTEPTENMFKGRVITDETQRQAIFDSLVRKEAGAWLKHHMGRWH